MKLLLPLAAFFLITTLVLGVAYGEENTSVSSMMASEINSAKSDGDTGIDFNWSKPAEKSGKKSGLKAGFLSLMLPGAGEYYLGNKSKAAVFLGAEAVIWSGYLAFHTYGGWLEDDYKSYAAEHADANISGKDSKFFDRMQFYESRDWYNEIEGLRYGEAYPYTDFYYWQWDSQVSRMKYREIRNNSKSAFRNATFMIGVSVLNRVVSFVDALRLAKKLNKAENFEIFGGWRFDYNASPFGSNPRASVKLVKTIN